MQYALEHPYLTAIILVILIYVMGDVFIAFANKRGRDDPNES